MNLVPGRTSEYRKRLSNPGRRSTIPDEYLKLISPKQYQVRMTNKANTARTTKNNKLYDPARVLSGSEIYSLAKAQASSAYDPAIDAATANRDAAVRNDSALLSRVAGYNQMANSAVAAAQTSAQSGAATLATQLAATRSETLGAIGQDQVNSQALASGDAALRGSDVTQGLSQRLASDFQQQRAGIATNLAAQETAGNIGAQGWTGLIGMMAGAQAMRGADTMAQLSNAGANRQYSLTQGIADIQGKKGAAQTDQITQLRNSEFEKGAAIETLGLKQQQADTDAKKTAFDAKFKVAKFKADQEYRRAEHELKVLTQEQAHGDRSSTLNQRIKEARQRHREAARRLDIAQGNLDNARERTGISREKLPTANETKSQWLPPVAQAHAISDFHRLQGDPALRKMKADGKSRQEAADAILGSDKWGKLDPALVTAALDMAYVGHLSPGTAAQLHRSKIKVSGLGVPVRKPKSVKVKKRSPSSGPAGGDPAGRYGS